MPKLFPEISRQDCLHRLGEEMTSVRRRINKYILLAVVQGLYRYNVNRNSKFGYFHKPSEIGNGSFYKGLHIFV